MQHALIRSSVTALAAVLATAASQLATSADLKVTGVIRPVACALKIGNGASVVKYDAIVRSQLNPNGFTKLDVREIDFAISCDGPVKVAVRATDGGTGKLTGLASVISSKATEEAMFGLGLADSTQPGSARIGAFHLAMKPDSFSGKDASDAALTLRAISRPNGVASGRWAASVDGSMSSIHEMSWAPLASDEPSSLVSVAGKLTVQAILNRREALPATQEINLNGAATIEMRYL